jgi:hypothetical protein
MNDTNYKYYAQRAGLYNCLRQFHNAIEDTFISLKINENYSTAYV